MGLGIGFHYGDQAGEGAAFVREMAVTLHPSNLGTVVLGSGTDEAREEALRSFLVFEERQRARGAPSATIAYKVDSMITRARLAAIYQRRADPQQADAQMRQAMSLCLDSGRKTKAEDCTAEKLTDFAIRMDALAAKNTAEHP
jgi:hypothetical protein